jgi:hypothetical protein
MFESLKGLWLVAPESLEAEVFMPLGGPPGRS